MQYDFPEYLVVKQQQSCDAQPTEFQYISTSTIEEAHYMPFKSSVNDNKIASLQNKISLKKACSTLTNYAAPIFSFQVSKGKTDHPPKAKP